jgi:hypothetical protein
VIDVFCLQIVLTLRKVEYISSIAHEAFVVGLKLGATQSGQ